MSKKCEFTVQVGWRNQYCGIEELEHQGITFYFVDNEYYFNREKLYGYFDDGERFAYFNRAVLDALQHIDYCPDVIHSHDWHTGMIPFLHRVEYRAKKGYEFIRTVFTIHNLQFQGIMPGAALGDLLGLDYSHFHPDKLEFFGNINFMKGGLVAADKITTVSPTYKYEIQTEYYGEKLHDLLKRRAYDLEGILNGIDDEFYNPEKDPFIKENYTFEKLQIKKENKMDLQKNSACR